MKIKPDRAGVFFALAHNREESQREASVIMSDR
jgi:hypothetical protein